MQIGPAYSQLEGRLRDIAAISLERLDDEFTFGLVAELTQRDPITRGSHRGCAFRDVVRQIFQPDVVRRS